MTRKISRRVTFRRNGHLNYVLIRWPIPRPQERKRRQFLSPGLLSNSAQKGWQYCGFHMTSLKFKLQNYWSSWNFIFMMYENSWRLLFIQIWVLGLVIDYAWISKLLRDVVFTWRPRELSCWLKVTISGNLHGGPEGPFGSLNFSCIRKSIILVFFTWSQLQFLDLMEYNSSILL